MRNSICLFIREHAVNACSYLYSYCYFYYKRCVKKNGNFLHIYILEKEYIFRIDSWERVKGMGMIQQLQGEKNVGQMKNVIVWFGTAFFGLILWGEYTGFFSMEDWYFVGALLGHIFLMTGFWLLIEKLLKEQQNKRYQELYCSFWGIVISEFIWMAWISKEKMMTMCILWIMIFMVGVIPQLSEVESGVYGAGMILSECVMVYTGHINFEQFLLFVSWYVLSVCLSYVRYKNFKKISLQRWELQEAVQEAETDPMTRIFNRRGLHRSMYTIVPYCKRNKVPVAVLMIDIDHFKKYNDTFGHRSGDACIQMVAEEIQKATRRQTDLAARVGGEEFLVFLTGLGEEDAISWGMRLHHSIKTRKLYHSKENIGSFVTVSMGVSCGFLGKIEDFENLWELADKELYQAKENGRDCLFLNGQRYAEEKLEENKEQRFGEDEVKVV